MDMRAEKPMSESLYYIALISNASSERLKHLQKHSVDACLNMLGDGVYILLENY